MSDKKWLATEIKAAEAEMRRLPRWVQEASRFEEREPQKRAQTANSGSRGVAVPKMGAK
jgi:hypothetical protein